MIRFDGVTKSFGRKTPVADMRKKVLNEQDATIIPASQEEAMCMLEAGEIDAILSMEPGTTELCVLNEGTSMSKNQAVSKVAAEAVSDFGEDARADLQAYIDEKKAEVQSRIGLTGLNSNFDINMDEFMPIQSLQTEYLHGSSDWEMFDFYGPIFIALFLFVFVFITCSFSLVNERAAGTMERFLDTPVKPAQILAGYALGFGAMSLVQAAIILSFGLGVIGFPNEGSIGLVVLIAISLAVASVMLGLLVSGLATAAFQVVQLMLLFVVPQILLCGLFDLSASPDWMQVL